MTRMLGGALALLLLLLPALAGAQSLTNNGTITANGGTVPLQALGTVSGTVQITGTWTGSITPIECSLDGVTYAAVPVTPIAGGATVVTTTGNGIWTFAGAFSVCRARATAAWTGTATVNLLSTRARVPTTLGGLGLSLPVTSAQGGTGQNFSASTGVLYDAAGTFSAIACASGLLQGGAPPTCTTSPVIGTATGTTLGLTGSLTTGDKIRTNGTAPGIGGSCGTGPSIAGTDVAGKVTTGSVAPTSCTVTFASAWASAPACVVTNETTANLARATSTTTTVVLAGTMVAGDVLAYICVGGS